MAQKMTEEEWRAFVSHGTRTGKLSTVRADGSPHVAPIWFLLDGDELVFNTGKETVKGRNLARDGRVALCVDDDRPPFAFVVLQGPARMSGGSRRAPALGGPASGPATWARSAPRSSVPATACPGNSSSASRIDKVARPHEGRRRLSTADRTRRRSAHRVEQPGGVHPPGVLDEPDQHLLPRVAVTGVAEHHGRSPVEVEGA